ncbi:glutathione S-transferase class-mu 26 kDa isozyme 51 [Caerostris darwini]|uniref:glutathione transferase n=1 Tax=Caerostris darwini TaxID=1538125 RepID=A0AAV4UJF8_9ARAC|nr:glutathione S-transferase class-mu 26 kDa isozyme 51 [Caerostris darwini]
MPKPIFGYWNVRGLAEPIRYLLHFKNVDFEDKRYSFHDRPTWENDKYNLDLDFPNLPYYIDDEVRLTQSATILRYLAEKYDFGGKTKQERLRVSLAEQQIIDFRDSLINLFYSPDFEKLKPEVVSKIPNHLKLVEKFLGDRKFLAGDTLTYVDFMACDTLDFCTYLVPKSLADYPALKAFQKRVKSLPELQSYLNSSTFVRWPIFSIRASFGGLGPEPSQE